jgi:hypothetical protein
MTVPENGDREMTPIEVFHRCIEILKANHFCALATSLEAKSRVRAMEYAIDDSGIIYMLTEGGRKVRDILLNPNVSFAVWETGESGKADDGGTGLRGLTITARAEVVDPGDSGRFGNYYGEYLRHIGREAPAIDMLPRTVKLIRVIPDVMELFDPSLQVEGYSPKQVWRR